VIDESESQCEKHFDPRISTFLGIKIDWSDENENASDSIRVKCEFDSNVIDESDLQFEKQYDPRISIFIPISIVGDLEKFRINLWWKTSIRKSFSITKISFPDSIEIDNGVTPTNAELSMNRTFRGITIDWSDEFENDSDSIRANREFNSNVIEESDVQYEKHCDPRISTLLGIKIDWSDEFENDSDSIRANRELDSNVIEESDVQCEKHCDPRISTLLGIKIDWSDDSENDSDSIRANREFDSNVIDENDLQCEKHFDPRISTVLGITIDWSDDSENANGSIRVNREFGSNAIDESELQLEKQCDPMISIFLPISIFDDCEKFRMSLWGKISIRIPFSITKLSFPDSIEIDNGVTQTNAEPSMDRTFRGITIDSSDE
jgi:hypothetical protein